MGPSGNIGEWSELYTLFKLLADGKLYAADADVKKINDIYYEIIKVIRTETGGKWEYIKNASVRIVEAATGNEILSLPTEDFLCQSAILFKELKKKNKTAGAFKLPETWNFANKIKCNTLKAKSIDKSDIIIMVHDAVVGSNPILGFSIKSQLGRASTLLNASAATNFVYKIVGHQLNDDEINTFTKYRLFKDKLNFLCDLGAKLVFYKIDNPTFNFNLMLVDTNLPTLVAETVKNYYESKSTLLSELSKLLIENNSLGLDENNANLFYPYKLKELLTNVALGMVPGKRWSGNYDATGGYIIVKDDGDVLCYHIYNRNQFRDYLFHNTKLDTPSTSKHGFGFIENTGFGQILKLNLQIRFVK